MTIMKNMKYILGVSLAALTLASCENFGDINQPADITDVRSFEYTLSGDDYKSIVSNSKNVAAALEACTPEDSSAYTAFLQVAQDKAFNDIASADLYVPAFIYAKFPQLSMGSMCNVTYNLVEGKPAYLADFASVTEYTLTKADYQTAWGSQTDFVQYLTPKTLSKLADIVSAAQDGPSEGDMVVVNYNYQDIEPNFATGGGSTEPAMPTPLADLIAEMDAGTAPDGTVVTISGYIVSMFLKPTNFAKYGSVSVWLNDSVGGTLKQFELYNCYGYNGDTLKTWGPNFTKEGTSNVDVTMVGDSIGNEWHVGDYITATGEVKKYVGSTSTTYELNTGCHFVQNSAAPARIAAVNAGANKALYQFTTAWAEYKQEKVSEVVIVEAAAAQIPAYLQSTHPLAVADDVVAVLYKNGKNWAAAEYSFNGAAWVENSGIITETMSFALTEEWLANLSVYYKQAIMGEGQGKLVTQDVSLGEGITYVWTYAASYGMKGTSYASGAHAAESWVVTPGIKLKNSKQPALNFDQAINYGPDDENRQKEMSVWVSTDYAGDVTTCNWTLLPWNAFDDATSLGFPETNSWTFYNTGDMDLSEWNGKTIYIGFRYYAEEGWTCSTWEFKNLLVHEVEE